MRLLTFVLMICFVIPTRFTIHNLDRNDMRELLILAAHEPFFIFDQVLYIQIDGVTMSSPLGPILANAFLCHFEKQWYLMIFL